MCTEDDDTVLTRKQVFWYEMWKGKKEMCVCVARTQDALSRNACLFVCLCFYQTLIGVSRIRLHINHENTSLFKKPWMTEAQVKVDK